MKPTSTNSNLPETYRDLCFTVWLPQPIADEVAYKNAVEIIDRLAFLANRTEGQDRYLEAIALFVEAYEAQGDTPPAAASVPELLRYLCEANEMSPADLSRLLGDKNRATGSNLLNGSREPSKAHIKILCDRFRLNPAAFF